MDLVTDLVQVIGASPWLLAAVFALALVDGLLPPVPSESAVIAAAVLTITGDGPHPLLLILAAAAGAFAGDLLAFTIGRRVPLGTSRLLGGQRGLRARAWAGDALQRRGATLVVSARFIPVGRVAVNLSAGALGFPLRRFLPAAGVAGLLWAAYSTVLGLGAGHLLHDRPLVALVVGVATGAATGFGIDAVMRRVRPDKRPLPTREAAERVPAPVPALR